MKASENQFQCIGIQRRDYFSKVQSDLESIGIKYAYGFWSPSEAVDKSHKNITGCPGEIWIQKHHAAHATKLLGLIYKIELIEDAIIVKERLAS